MSQGIAVDVISYLIGFLPSTNITCRQKASEGLKIISSHAIGKTSILAEKYNLMKMAKIVGSEVTGRLKMKMT